MSSSFNPGQFLILGFEGLEPDSRFLDFVKETPPAGFLLLGENYQDRNQLKTLSSRLRADMGDDILIMADQEPGRVQRFKAGFPQSKTPSQFIRQGNPKDFQGWCQETAEKLANAGVNVNLAPILDLWPFDRDYPVLNNRSLGDDAGKVILFSLIMIEVFRGYRVHTCAKHFPGLGAARGDPHEVLATSDENLSRFLEYHWAPFRAAVADGVSFVMTTHLLCHSIDSEHCATFSKNMINHIRYTVRHDGPVISDDLCMKGARGERSIGMAAVDAIIAGHDLVIISRDLDSQKEAVYAISEHLEQDPAFGRMAAESRKRLKRIEGIL